MCFCGPTKVNTKRVAVLQRFWPFLKGRLRNKNDRLFVGFSTGQACKLHFGESSMIRDVFVLIFIKCNPMSHNTDFLLRTMKFETHAHFVCLEIWLGV